MSSTGCLKPRLTAAYAGRAAAFLGTEQYDRAVSDLSQALALEPGDARAHLNRGVAHLKRERFDRAIEDFDRALDEARRAVVRSRPPNRCD